MNGKVVSKMRYIDITSYKERIFETGDLSTESGWKVACRQLSIEMA